MIGLIITIVVLGVIVWFVNTYIPMPAPFKTLIWVIAALFVLVLVLRALGIFGGSGGGVSVGTVGMVIDHIKTTYLA
jgi:hypothetical protein